MCSHSAAEGGDDFGGQDLGLVGDVGALRHEVQGREAEVEEPGELLGAAGFGNVSVTPSETGYNIITGTA